MAIIDSIKDNRILIKNIARYLLAYGLNSLRIILMKIAMDKWFVSTYKALFIVGIFGNIIIFFVIVISTLLRIERFSFDTVMLVPFNHCRSNYVYIIGMFFNIFNTLTNQHLLLFMLVLGIFYQV